MLYFYSALLAALVAVLFALQNIEPVYVKFLVWHLQVPLALALALAFTLGALSVLLLSLAGKLRGSRRIPSGTPKPS